MTWVIGASTPFLGHGIVVSDIRVTFNNGETADMLQKAYPVGNFMVAGFAGSVLIGFRLLDSLTQSLALPHEVAKTQAWDPAWVARKWAPRAKAIFDSSSPQEKALGSQLLLVGISPTENTGAPELSKVYIVRFSAPNFKAGFMNKRTRACNIGSGAGVNRYKQVMKPFLNNLSYALQAETVGFGAWARTIAYSMSNVITDYPNEGISEHLNVFVFQLGRIAETNTDRTIYPPDSTPVEIRMPKVARSYAEFQEMVKKMGIGSAYATC